MAKAKNKLSFEEMMKELEQCLDRMEGGELTLDELMKEYSAGSELIARCRARLDQAAAVLDAAAEDKAADAAADSAEQTEVY